MLSFTRAEFQERLKNVKAKMQERGIEVLLITDPANMNYLTGYNAWSFYVHQMVMVLLDEEEPLWIGRYMDSIAAKKVTYLKHENIIPYPDTYVQNDSKHPMDFFAAELAKRSQGDKNIAVEMDNYYFTAQAYLSLVKGLPNAKFVDAKGLVNWVRLVKSDAEIALMQRAGKIIEKGMMDAIEKVNVGVRQNDLAATIYKSMIEGTDEFGGDYTAIVPLMPSGENTGACHLTWTDDKYYDGEAVVLELAGCHQRYHSPLARTIYLGEPSKKMQDMADITIEGINTTLDFIKPGVTCEEIEAAWNGVLKRYGLEKESRIGYSTGLNYPPDWGEHTISLRPGDKTIVQPNMTFHVITGMWYDEFGFEVSEAIRITETGCETFANVPRKLFVKK